MAASTQHCVRDDVNVCQLCGDLDNLSVCGGCKGAWYCSKSHQKQDWKKHKLICKRVEKSVHVNCVSDQSQKRGLANSNNERMTNNKEVTEDDDQTVTESDVLSSSDTSNFVTISKCDSEDTDKSTENVDNQDTDRDNSQHVQIDQLTKIHPPKTYKTKHKTRKHNNTSSNVQQQRYYLDQTTQVFDLPPSISGLSRDKLSDSTKPDDSLSSLGSRDQYLLILQARFNEVSKYVVKCLTQYGICVVDKFLGDATCQKIFEEAIQLKSSGVMNQGQLVKGPASSSKNKQIRGDIITWVDGGENACQNIHYLISCMDTVMLQVAKSLENCNINERTKAMVACYPGRGRGYIRHIDNPNGDGRCVTSIYYLNKDWDVRNDGGLLRIYPEGSDQVANIEPICDRLLFFWSDRRNPHEVEKALRERYAITVWYYDADERAEALKRLKDGASN